VLQFLDALDNENDIVLGKIKDLVIIEFACNYSNTGYSNDCYEKYNVLFGE